MSVDTNTDSWGQYPDDIEGNVLLRSDQKSGSEEIGKLTGFCYLWSRLARHANIILKLTPSQRKTMQQKYVTPAAYRCFSRAATANKKPEDEYLHIDYEEMARQTWDLDPRMDMVFRGIGFGTRNPDPSAPGGVRDTPFASCPPM